MDSLRYSVMDFNKENQFLLCLWNQRTLQTNTQTSTRAIYHPKKFHHVVCLLWKGKDWKSEIRPKFQEEFLHCSVFLQALPPVVPLFSFFHEKNVTSRKMWLSVFSSFAQGFNRRFHTYCIHSLGMVPTTFLLLLSGFIRKMWLLFSVCALIPSIQGEENALVG